MNRENQERSKAKSFKSSFAAILLAIIIIAITITLIIVGQQMDKKNKSPIKTAEYEYKIDGQEEYKINVEMNTEDLTYRYEVETDHQVFSTYDSEGTVPFSK